MFVNGEYMYMLNIHNDRETNMTFDPYFGQMTLARVPLLSNRTTETQICINSIIPGVVTHVTLEQTTKNSIAIAYRVISEELG